MNAGGAGSRGVVSSETWLGGSTAEFGIDSSCVAGRERPKAESALTTIKLAPRVANHRGLSRSPVLGLVKNDNEAIEERKSDDKLNSVNGMDKAKPGCDLK